MVSKVVSGVIGVIFMLHAAVAVRNEVSFHKFAQVGTELCVATVNVLAVALSDPTPTGFPTMTSELLEKKKTWIHETLLPQLLTQMPCLDLVSLQEVDAELAGGVEQWGRANGFTVHKSPGTKDVVLLLAKDETFPEQDCTSEDADWVKCELRDLDVLITVLGGHAPSEGLTSLNTEGVDIILADANMEAQKFAEVTGSAFSAKPDGDELTTCKAQFRYRKLAQAVANSKNFLGFDDDVTCAAAMCQGEKLDGCCSMDKDAASGKWLAVHLDHHSKPARETCRRAAAICGGTDKKLRPELESMFEEMKNAGRETAVPDLKLKEVYQLIHCQDDACEEELPAATLEKYLETQCKQEDLIAVKASRFDFFQFRQWRNGASDQLPNEAWPSDHFSLMARVAFKTRD